MLNLDSFIQKYENGACGVETVECNMAHTRLIVARGIGGTRVRSRSLVNMVPESV